MRVQSLKLKDFKRFNDLELDLGVNPKKIIALVGPNGCGKSSIFDALEAKFYIDSFNSQKQFPRAQDFYIKQGVGLPIDSVVAYYDPRQLIGLKSPLRVSP